MEEKNEILAAISELDRKFDQRFQALDRKFDERFQTLEADFDKLHQSQIKLEGMRSDFNAIAEAVTQLSDRVAAWDGADDEESIPVRVSRLEVRVTRLEKKKRT
jgi:ABC-type phosphate transport system auxiliary subunit